MIIILPLNISTANSNKGFLNHRKLNYFELLCFVIHCEAKKDFFFPKAISFSYYRSKHSLLLI